MKQRAAILLLMGVAFLYLGLGELRIEEDLTRALEDSYPERSELFRTFQGTKFASDRIFIRPPDEASLKPLEELAERYGYEPTDFISMDPSSLSFVYKLYPYLSHRLDQLFSPGAIRQRAEMIRNWLYLPGGGELWQRAQKDPLGLNEAVVRGYLNDIKPGPLVLVFKRGEALDFHKVQGFRDQLIKGFPAAVWTGADFFALENYLVVKRDIVLCTIISLVVGLVIFYYLCPNLWLLLILFLGTGLSYVFGIVSAQLFYPFVYTIVLTFTSTFVGFNNEYLIHFSAIKKVSWRAVVGLGSAIGTTLIGFVSIEWFVDQGHVVLAGMFATVFQSFRKVFSRCRCINAITAAALHGTDDRHRAEPARRIDDGTNERLGFLAFGFFRVGQLQAMLHPTGTCPQRGKLHAGGIQMIA